MSERTSSRIPGITSREHLPAGAREHFDSIDASRGGVRGPFPLLFHSPEIAGRTGHLGAYIRYEGQLSGQKRELAIITAARACDCAYEWAVHVPLARREGVREDAISAVAHRDSVTALSEIERAIIRYGRELLRVNQVSDDTFRMVAEQFETQHLVELTATLGYYAMLASTLNAFDVQPDDTAPQLP